MDNVKNRNMKGENGGTYLGGAGSVSGDFDTIFAHEDSVVDATSGTITGTLTNVKIPAGARWHGRFNTVTWVSGSVTVYAAA